MLRLITLFILAASTMAFAQISLTSTDALNWIGLSQTIEYDTTFSITVDVGSAGPNQSWNFSSIPTHLENTVSIISPAGTPFEDDFPTANFVEFYNMSAGDTVFQLYSYAEVSSDLFLTLGDGNIIHIPSFIDTSYADSSREETPLPLTYGSQWSTENGDTTDYVSFKYVTVEKSENTVDAWGTVTVPAGTFDCLRLRENYSYVTKSVIGDFEVTIDSTSNINYTWLSKNNYAICNIESQDGETNPEFTTASYFTRLKSGTSALPENKGPELLTGFSLEQNYPNPFNPETEIAYTLGKAGNVDLSIYDAAGQLVQNLVSGYQNAGRHSVRWDATGLSSGIYYYKIKSGEFLQIKKATLLK